MARSYKEEYQYWLDSPSLSEAEWKELSDIAGNDDEIESRFFAPLEFGTAGLRGEMAVGLRRMNVHVIRWATQAFASVIRDEGDKACDDGIVICYDCRINSEVFAREAAAVMAANGVRVRLFDALRPTPELSFAVRYYGATAGVNVTASHNPKEYNGYKVYWSDGAQLPPKHASAIAERMNGLDIFRDIKTMPFEDAVNSGMIEYIGEQTDEAFLSNVVSMAIDPDVVKAVSDDFRVVYTPFHGAGHKLVPEALRRLGMKHIFPEPRQMVIDGAFPTVVSPNPENPEGFYLAVELAKQVDSDLIIGTDPDSDRVGVMVRNKNGEYQAISGNQMGVLLLDYIISARREKGTLPENAAFITTIVTTNMAREVAEKNGVHTDLTFTGFKFMAEKLAEYERDGSYEYLLAFEESYGYMIGGFVRDKDAVTASMMITEMAAHYFAKGMTLADALESLYEKYGWYAEKTLNLVMPGLDGLEKMKTIMSSLRSAPPRDICGVPLVGMRDYLSGAVSVADLGVVDKTHIVGSNVLYFELEDGTSFIVRPSGTEPKIKVYLLVNGADGEECAQKLEKYTQYAESLGK